MRRASLFVIAVCANIILLSACAPKNSERQRGQRDLENAIEVIESRKEAELGIVVSHEKEIELLEQNVTKVNSDAMRRKIQSEINMKNLGIEKAQKNMANQDTILFQLRNKLDSINAAGE